MANMTEYVKKQLKVLETENTIKVDYRPVNDYVNAFQELGTYDEDWETNGWEVDFWIYFEVNGTKYRFSGSWYYGGYTISKEH